MLKFLSIKVLIGIMLLAPGRLWAMALEPEDVFPSVASSGVESPSTESSSIIVYDFTVDVTEGSLSGMKIDGSFCYDAATVSGVGTETIGVADGLKVGIIFFNQTFTESNDVDYPDFPTLTFFDGAIEKLDFWIEEGDRLVWWDLPGWNVTLIPTEPGTECPVNSAVSPLSPLLPTP